LCEIARANGVTTFVDAAQSVGHQPVDVQRIGCDFLATSAHKMCGPSGIGALYGRYGLLEKMRPWHFGGEMVERAYFDRPATYREPPARFEAGTPAIIEAAGWGAAMEFIRNVGIENIHEHSLTLGNMTAEALRGIGGLRVFGPERRESGIVAFAIDGVHAHDFAFFANQRGVAVRAGHHCAQPLMNKLGAPSSNRASVYLYNSPGDIDTLVKTVQEAVAFFR
jgi:cysteine desulfurase/selenocysteine lyase